MCSIQEEDRIHILTCPSIEACMNREESRANARKAMKHWKLPNDFWTAMEKGLHGYTNHPMDGAINTPFPPMYDNRRNYLKLAFREQDMIGWENLVKHTEREHQTTGKRVGTKNDTRPTGPHDTPLVISERSYSQRR
jgi:hypothetical protein